MGCSVMRYSTVQCSGVCCETFEADVHAHLAEGERDAGV